MTKQSKLEDILIYPARWRMLANVVLYGAFVFTGFALIVTSEQISRLIGASAVIYFGLLLAYTLLRLTKHAPSLVINPQGIIDNASITSVGLIPWGSVTDIARKKNYLVHHVAISVADRDAVVSQVPLPRRCLVQLMDIIAQGSVNITPGFIEIPLDELEAVLQNSWKHQRN